MNFSNLYRVSFYVMLVLSSLAMSMENADSKAAPFYPLAVAAAAVLAFFTVDQKPERGFRPGLTNALSLGSILLAFAEFLAEPSALVNTLGHWLVYLVLIMMFRTKSVRDDWRLFLLGLVQVLIGTVVSQSDRVGVILFTWAVLALWVLGLFSLRREALRAQGDALAGATGAGLYPGLLNLPFLASTLRVMLTTLALGGVIFLAMPRQRGLARTGGVDTVTRHLTGFDDEVRLGQMGEILENDSVVMTVEFFDDAGARVNPGPEPLWRGVTLSSYEQGRWTRQGRRSISFPVVSPSWGAGPGRPPGVIRQQIKLEANDSSVLFGLRPMFGAGSGGRLGPDLNAIDGTIARPDPRASTYDYEVRSYRDGERPQPGERVPGAAGLAQLTAMPEALRPRFRAIALRVIEAALPPDRRDDPRARARALEAYLRDSGQFGYTLKLGAVDRALDPVEDFLVNRKEGHCEYFASALTLLLRSVGVPARMVNGFKGGDWNGLGRMLSVRQKHAHSWVEAYLGETPGPDTAPVWLTLDPSPGSERDRSVARVGGFASYFRQVTDLIRYVWVFYVVGYNRDRQERLLYGPIRALAAEARNGFGLMGQGLRFTLGRLKTLLHFPDVRSFISVRGFVVSFAGLLVLAGLARAAAWLAQRAYRWLRGPDAGAGALNAGAAQYRRLALLLGRYGLERPPAETQDEFARRATLFLATRGSDAEAVADVPALVVEAFYRVRFGHLSLPGESLARLDARLDALEQRLNTSQA